jgi:AP-3 complex subunit mu
MIHSFFVISSTGEILIEKHYRGVINRSLCDLFWNEVTSASSFEEVLPVITTPKHYLFHVYRHRMFFLANVTAEAPPLLVVEYLNRVVDTFQEYFGEVSEEAIKENFVTIYQLLDEMMDNGFPFTTEPNILKSMIVPPTMFNRVANMVSTRSNVVEELPEGASSNIPWRKKGVKYTNNEIYFDIVEEIDCILDANGMVVSSEVSGELQCTSKLSGMPDLTLSFANPQILDDCSFHPCVRYNRFEKDRVMSFVPPDGFFSLAKYRVNKGMTDIMMPLYCKPQFTFHEQTGRVNIMVGPKQSMQNKTIDGVTVLIPFNKSVSGVNLQCNVGHVSCEETTKQARWEIGRLPKDRTPSLSGTITLFPNAPTPESGPTCSVEFKVVMFCVSGLKIDALQCTNEKYKPYKGVRSVTKAGKFQVRS